MSLRLLGSDSATYNGKAATTIADFGFIDTLHQYRGAVSVFNQKKFTNQFAAMPSMYFGYALLVGVIIVTLPLSSESRQRCRLRLPIPVAIMRRPTRTLKFMLPGWTRFTLLVVRVAYPVIILIAIIATANYFVPEAIPGGLVVGIAWKCNGIIVNLRGWRTGYLADLDA
jgi:hypothetical protein